MISGTTDKTVVVSPDGRSQVKAQKVSGKVSAAQKMLNDLHAAEADKEVQLETESDKLNAIDVTAPGAQAKVSIINSKIKNIKDGINRIRQDKVTADATLQAALKEADEEGLGLEDLKGVAATAKDIALVVAAWSIDRPPAPQSAREAALELSNVAADTGVQANRQIADFAGKYGVNDLLGDNDIRTAFEQSGQSDFGAWLRSELASGSPVGQRINALTNPMAAEERERGDRITEASQFYDTYDASKFRSPEQQAAMAYATGMAADPLDIQLGEYIGKELAGEYDPEWYRDIRREAFKGVHPSVLAGGAGMQAAMFATDAAKRQRQQAGASMAHQTLGRKMAYAPSYASIANMGSPDPLAMTNVGKMGIGEIQPMDPTGSFFASFPARQQDAAMAAYEGQKSVQDKTTALQNLAESLAMYGGT